MSRRRRRRKTVLYAGLAIIAGLSVVSAVLQAAAAIGHLIALVLLMAMAAGMFYLGRWSIGRYERRSPQRRIRPRPRAPRQGRRKPPAAPAEAPEATVPPPSRDDLLSDPRSGARPLRGDL